ncbi:MAG: secondary thiamine-phosphate synthase enzyme YjbQ [Candidatus Neomarinimicrobiota bacterium]|nr:MAG: YjbQ family protein [bacterium]|tara:strand:+ start:5972 stop:6397 length:426 start_codon:yes stop_codon:yes gene_type:complete
MWLQKKILISPKPRGFHLITSDIINNINIINTVKNGLLNLFIKHTSASLTINENTDPTVRNDFESHFNQIVPEQQGYYSHTMEGPDDMPAHLKSSILGASINIPITNGKLNLGTWQGIYLCEHRNRGGSRKIIATINGDSI